MSGSALPALRSVDVVPLNHQGEVRFLLKDLEELSSDAVVLNSEDFFVAASFDGRSTIDQIRSRFARQFEMKILPTARIEKIFSILDSCYLLETPRFKERYEAIRREYDASPVRPAALANVSYPGDKEKLATLLDGYSNRPGSLNNVGLMDDVLVGLVAPHVDFARGGHSYAWAYQEILSRGMADLYVILGVAHAGAPAPFVLTFKDFETPFGTVLTDRELARRLNQQTGISWHEHEFVLRREHSIEFQALWLKYCQRRQHKEANLKVLSLACGQFSQPDQDPGGEVHRVLEILRDLIKNYSGTVCLVAGVDFSHVGPRFGDHEPMETLIPWIEREDQQSIGFLLEKKPLEFYRSVMAGGGKRKVCGSSALYCFSWLMRELYPQAQGRLLRYAHAPDPSGGEVSFASMSFVQQRQVSAGSFQSSA